MAHGSEKPMCLIDLKKPREVSYPNEIEAV
jgi:hypothetical protein